MFYHPDAMNRVPTGYRGYHQTLLMRAKAMPTVGGELACAAALTVGLTFSILFCQEKSIEKNIMR